MTKVNDGSITEAVTKVDNNMAAEPNDINAINNETRNTQAEVIAEENINTGKELVWLKKSGAIQKGEAVLTLR